MLQQKGLPIYAFDPRRAQALLGELGWSRGADGLFRSSSGEPFAFELWTSSAKPDSVRETEAIAAQWRETGLSITTYHIPDEAADKAFQKTQFTGFMGAPTANNPETLQKFHSSVIPTEQNRWRGANVSAYSNPAFDQLYDRYITSLQPAPRNELLAQMLKLDADQVLSVHLYYDMATNIGAIRNGLKGPLPVSSRQTVQTWNVHTWQLD
jgi:peptide/nickel transport system substrate-binding protein